jgi:hypothetical protein
MSEIIPPDPPAPQTDRYPKNALLLLLVLILELVFFDGLSWIKSRVRW